MRKITCGCGTTVRGDTDEAVVRLAERHIAIRHGGVGTAAGREDLLALAQDDLVSAADAPGARRLPASL